MWLQREGIACAQLARSRRRVWLTCAALATAALGLGASPNGARPWKRVAVDGEITVWSRPSPDRSIREVRAQLDLEQEIDRIWSVVNDVERYVEFMPYIQEVRVVGTDSDGSTLVYERIEPPLVDPRDYTLRITTSRDVERGIYLRRFTTANQRGPAPKKGVVRVPLCDGGWRLERLGEGRTRLTYTLLTEPGGAIPAWIANLSNRSSLPDLMRAVASRARDPHWRRE